MAIKYRWTSGWSLSDPLGVALRVLTHYPLAVPRVGNLFLGVTPPIPAGPYGGNFDAIARARAADLWSRFDTLFVLWSGGIDSTLVAALLAATRGDKRLIISDSGRLETNTGPEVFQWLLDQGCEFIEATTASMRQVVDQGGMVVSGHHADSLLLGEYAVLGNDLFHIEMQEAVMRHTGLTQAWAQKQIDACQELFDYLELEHTVPNLCWWLDFTSCWAQDEMSLHLSHGLEAPGVGYETFFGTDDFQRWAMQPVEDKIGRGNKAFKYRYLSLLEEAMGFKPTMVPRNSDHLADGDQIPLGSFLAIREDWSLVLSGSN